MAQVFRAWSLERQDFAVIKLLDPELDDTPMLRQRWDTEAKLGQWLDHPSIARIVDAGRDNYGHAYLAMEYVGGQTLRAIHEELLARERRFPPHLAIAVTQVVLHALEVVHAARSPETGRPLGIVHRDLKPANVMITYDGRVKVLDFGVARVDLGALRTKTGMLTGTPSYMSPEQVMADRRIDHRSDVYSWATVLHELLRGEPLVPETSERIDQLKAVLTDPPPPVQPAVPELKSKAVDEVLQKALEKEPEDRFTNAAAFWRALERAASTELGVGSRDELGRLVRFLFPGGLEKEHILRTRPRARSAPLTQVVDERRSDPPSAVEPQSMDERPADPGPLPPSPLEVPPEVPGYEVKGRLGEGGTGVVFLVEHITSGAERALKVLRPELAGNPDVRRRFGVEAQLGQRIKHPGVVQVFEVGEDAAGRPYMVMERIMGQDLAQWLRRLDRAGRRMPPEAAIRISMDVLDTLEHVHQLRGSQGRLGIVHRDLKPSNVMVGPQGQVKVLDFGIARAWLGQSRTRTGYRSGTEMYMSPEQALARKDLDFRSDIYSWATVLYELLMGVPLLMETDVIELLPTIVHTPPEKLLRPLLDVTPRLEAPLARALAKQPSDRFPSAAAFSAALAAAAPDFVGLSAPSLGRMWQANPPDGPLHGRPTAAPPPADATKDPAEAPTDGLPVLPGYKVHKKLDEGGCGELWLATKGSDATWWVIKTLRPDLARRPDIGRRFEREIRILAELDHPHVVRVHGARRTPQGHLFTVMEFIRGLDFERVLYHFRAQGRLLPADLSLRVVIDVLAGLHAAHELKESGRPVGVVHRDLSPRNLMVDADGTTKVIDFGLAAAQMTSEPYRTRADVGTPRFWSPEQARGKVGIDRRSDVYAAAVILYEALVGRAVAPFAELSEIRRAVVDDRPPLVHEIVPTLPETLSAVVARALSKEADDRFDTAEAFAKALVDAWADRPIRSHAGVAEFLRAEGPPAYGQSAAQSPVAVDLSGPNPQDIATHDGLPSDILQDALHPPTRQGVATSTPRKTGRWVIAASVAAVFATVAALTATVPSAPRKEAKRARPTESRPAVSVAAIAEPARAAPAPDTAPKVTSPRSRTADKPAPAPKRAVVNRTAPRPSAPPQRPPSPRPKKTPTAPAAQDEADGILTRIRNESRNRVEAAEMLRRAARAAEADGRIDGPARSRLEACLQRRFMDPRDRVIRECGRWLQR